MINEMSINFVNKFFDRITKLNAGGGVLACSSDDVNIDKAVLHILPVPSDNDGVITLIRHMAQMQVRLNQYMSVIDSFGVNAAWSYSMASNMLMLISKKRDESYIQLKKNRGDGTTFGSVRVSDVYHGKTGRRD